MERTGAVEPGGRESLDRPGVDEVEPTDVNALKPGERGSGLLTWRMALAQNLLCRRQGGIAEAAKRVGYGSASTFSVAFARHIGVPPGQLADSQRPA